MAVRKIPLEGGGYIKFENDEEYHEWLQKKEELRRQQQEEEEFKLKLKAIGIFILLGFLGILGLCSESNQKKEKKETVKTAKKETFTKKQVEQNTLVVNPSTSNVMQVEAPKEMASEPVANVIEEMERNEDFEEYEDVDDYGDLVEHGGVGEYDDSYEPEESIDEATVESDFRDGKVYQRMEVDEVPKYPGGENGLMAYIAENTVYPQKALEEGVHGRVFVSCIIEPDGKVTNVEVLRGIGGGCDEEAVRVIQSLPNWEPGVRRGKNVRVAFVVPVKFALE